MNCRVADFIGYSIFLEIFLEMLFSVAFGVPEKSVFTRLFRAFATTMLANFQDWIVPLPGVHGSALCILNFTAKKDKKELKWTVFGKNARKLCEKGKNPKKIQAKN